MKKKEVISANYLDFVPRHRPSLQYTMDNQGKITLLQENKGVFHFLDKAEPLYDRLVQYIRNLEAYGFVEVQGEK